MAKQQAEKEKTEKVGYPWGAIIFGTLTVAYLVRGLYHARRAVMEAASILRCPGDVCSPLLMLASQAVAGGAPGQVSSEVYAVTSGKVIPSPLGGALSGALVIASDLEPALLFYVGLEQAMVVPGQHVALGQQLGVAKQLGFGVGRIEAQPPGTPLLQMIEPSSWLATHGMRYSWQTDYSTAWCGQGRALTVPSSLLQCDIKLPQPPGALLLPVSVTTN